MTVSVRGMLRCVRIAADAVHLAVCAEKHTHRDCGDWDLAQRQIDLRSTDSAQRRACGKEK